MRRATAMLVLIVCATPVLHAPPVCAKGQPIMNAIGLIDYTHEPTFKPGDWVKYRVSGANSEGVTADYFVTILIAGEERFWGEDCFWVETRTQAVTSTAPVVVATLMSYSIFDDTLAVPHMKLFMRKTITDVNEDGTVVEDVTKRPALTLRNRKPPSEHTEWSVDSVGVDTVLVPRGLFHCTKVRMQEGVAASQDRADSSSRTVVRDIRTEYFADGVPVTRLAREVIENTIHRKAWAIGRSQEGPPEQLVGISRGDARLVDFGSGLQSGMVPERLRRSLREQDAARSVATKPKAKRTS